MTPAKNGAVLIYFDYELQSGADLSMRQISDKAKVEYELTFKLLDLLKKHDVKVTFATVGNIAKKGKLYYNAPHQVKKIAKEGHEIASHGLTHEAVSNMSYSGMLQDFKESKRLLESVSKQKVISYAPPKNMPHPLLGLDITKAQKGKTKGRLGFSTVTHAQVFNALKQAGFKTYRLYYPNPLQRRNTWSNLKNKQGIYTFRLNLPAGFGEEAKSFVKKCFDKNEVAVVYGHSKDNQFCPLEKQEVLADFLKYIKGLEKKGLWITTPRKIVETLEKGEKR